MDSTLNTGDCDLCLEDRDICKLIYTFQLEGVALGTLDGVHCMLMAVCCVCADFVKAVNALLPDVIAVLGAEPEEEALTKASALHSHPPSKHMQLVLLNVAVLNSNIVLYRATADLGIF